MTPPSVYYSHLMFLLGVGRTEVTLVDHSHYNSDESWEKLLKQIDHESYSLGMNGIQELKMPYHPLNVENSSLKLMENMTAGYFGTNNLF